MKVESLHLIITNKINRGRSTNKCKTDKTTQYTCDVKVKTCGLLLACTPCGFILNVKKFYGAESCPQIALFYPENRKNLEGVTNVKFTPQKRENSKRAFA
jgi:hypothetical protein